MSNRPSAQENARPGGGLSAMRIALLHERLVRAWRRDPSCLARIEEALERAIHYDPMRELGTVAAELDSELSAIQSWLTAPGSLVSVVDRADCVRFVQGPAESDLREPSEVLLHAHVGRLVVAMGSMALYDAVLLASQSPGDHREAHDAVWTHSARCGEGLTLILSAVRPGQVH